ncbi:tetratricopeptide repeat protein [Acidovorax sp.]|uniref:YfgM family protein n=1 Tax=Acidovorax sp. TaxID=1872122 RepID=UPI00260E57CB|nr:tetratricopeptide repeat protein [Acidovorax sp.]
MAKHLDLEEQEQLDQLKHFWNTWGTLISSVVLVVAGSVAAWNGYQYWQNRQATQAAALFDAVDVAAKSGEKARLEQAFGDLKSKYAGTTQAGQAGLLVAKSMQDAGNSDGAKDALTWVAEQSKDEGLKALAQLRLASVLMEQKNYDEALKQVSGSFPPEFASVVADRKGDVLQLQDKRQEAIAEYTKAYKGLEEGVEYRRLVEIKLNALGVSPQGATVIAATNSPVEAK